MDDELERFKREVDLVELASFYGYRLHGRPSRTSLKMKNEGSTIIVAVDDKDGHGVFFEVLGVAGGSVIDFVKWQKGVNLGYARKALREYTGEARDTEEQRIIIAESAIDAMSCYQLNPSDGIYLSIAGGLNETQPELLRRILAQFPHARIFIATDSDLPTKERPIPEGEHYYEVMCGLCPPTATVIRARPPEPYKDWNDKLTGKPRQPKKGELSHVARIGETRSAATGREHTH